MFYSNKNIYTLLVLCFFYSCIVHGQSKILSYLTDFYKNANKDCYTELIQESIDEFNSWLSVNNDKEWVEDYFAFELNSYLLKPSIVNLQEERKVFILSTYFNWFKFEETPNLDFEDYLEIDSTRTFMVACLDGNDYVKGISDLGEVGMYVKTAKKKNKGCCIWVNMDVFHSYKGRNSFKRAYKKHPEFKNAEAIIYLQNEKPSYISTYFGFIIGDELVIWDIFSERVMDKSDYMSRLSYHKLKGNSTWDNYLKGMNDYYKKNMNYTTIRDTAVFKNGYRTKDELQESERRYYGQTSIDRIRTCQE